MNCRCAKFWDAGDLWYPRRLLDLEGVRSADGLRNLRSPIVLSDRSGLARTRVRLIESGDIDIKAQENNRYVTLSHCWGKPKKGQQQLKLTTETEARFKGEGIELREFPRTFREAVLFASRLDRVGYIWIDSLCIKQRSDSGGDQTESKEDWLNQSRVMDKIYQRGYLNISATASEDGDQGLFRSRQPEHLWEDEINVLYAATSSMSSLHRGNDDRGSLIRCTLVDLSLWDDLVEKAPVNRRGWVLQERVLSPRVLHFCHDQIAWECAEYRDAEGQPGEYPIASLISSVISDHTRLKNMTKAHGFALRAIRFEGRPDPDEDLKDLWVFELWKCLVEAYSRTQLTMSSDKLIALSGIARVVSSKFEGGNSEYVAGLWRTHLESQLLWHVVEKYRKGSFENPARRDATRAPSFSWAAIDSPYGIVYGETTDYGRERSQTLLFEVVKYMAVPIDPMNPFGLVKESWLLLKAIYLRRITLRRQEPRAVLPYSWSLWDTSSKRLKEYFVLQLDAPDSDPDVFEDDAETYCMPAVFDEQGIRTSSSYLICLLLKWEGTETKTGFRRFRRIGMTNLSYFMDEKGYKALMEEKVDELFYLL